MSRTSMTGASGWKTSKEVAKLAKKVKKLIILLRNLILLYHFKNHYKFQVKEPVQLRMERFTAPHNATHFS